MQRIFRTQVKSLYPPEIQASITLAASKKHHAHSTYVFLPRLSLSTTFICLVQTVRAGLGRKDKRGTNELGYISPLYSILSRCRSRDRRWGMFLLEFCWFSCVLVGNLRAREMKRKTLHQSSRFILDESQWDSGASAGICGEQPVGHVCLRKQSHRTQGVIKWGREQFTWTEGWHTVTWMNFPSFQRKYIY